MVGIGWVSLIYIINKLTANQMNYEALLEELGLDGTP